MSQPTKAFQFASIGVLAVGGIGFLAGLANATMLMNEKGYYLAVLLLGLFSFISLQKTVRDKAEGLTTSRPYYILCWVAATASVGLMSIGLYNADLLLSEKGFYAMAFLLCGFGAITVQKNVRDMLNDDE